MNKTCARCTKVVYPLEELKCLEKSWHKTCFKCTECGMVLNMKTYKGFNKFPYCEAHIPKAKATTIADTPELKRIAENTKIQSNVQYHADFEKSKGKVTQVADDPETLRIKQNTKQISNVAYHGDLEKKAAMERQRETGEITESRDKNDEDAEYFSEQLAAEFQSHSGPMPPPPAAAAPTQQTNKSSAVPIIESNHHHHHHSDHYNNNNGGTPTHGQQQQHQRRVQESAVEQLQRTAPPGVAAAGGGGYRTTNPAISGSAYPSGGAAAAAAAANNVMHMNNNNHQHSQMMMNPEMMQRNAVGYDPYDNYSRPVVNQVTGAPQQVQQQHHQAQQNNNNNYGGYNNSVNVAQGQQQQQQQQQMYGRYPNNNNGGGLGYDPVAMAYAGQQQQQAQQYHMNNNNHMNYEGGAGNIGKIADYDPLTDGPRKNIPNVQRPSSTLVYSSVSSSNHPNRRVGSINDIDPVNGVYGSIAMDHQLQQQQQQQQYAEMMMRRQQQAQQQAQQQQQSRSQKYRIFRAVYDYEAKDVDEVSFLEGDLIYELESIDAGWMTGRVERTGKTGMLPANYLELAKI